MANVPNWANNTRPDWGGASQNVDLHIEEHLGIVDASFGTTSKLLPLANVKDLDGTNVARIDRLGTAEVKGRKAGDTLETTPVKSDKFNLSVDTVLYVRNRFDKFDQWTAANADRAQYAREAGLQLAKQFDRACIGQLQKAAVWTAPAHLAGAFHNGIKVAVTLDTAANKEKANAEAIVRAHRKSIESFIDRDLGDQLLAEGVTLVSPQVFTLLLEHDKLQNVQYGAGDSNSFVQARVAFMNGVRVIETARFAQAIVTASPLGTGHNLTAAEIKRQVITFIPSLALVTLQVHPVDGDYWEDKENFGWVLDTYQSYNIGVRRPDAVACLEIANLPNGAGM